MAAGTYTAADISAAVVPDMSGFFSEAEAKIRAWDPPEIVIQPEISEPEGGNSSEGPLAALGLVAAGAALGLLVGKAIGDAIEIQGVQAKLAVQLGGTPELAAKAGAIAGRLYSQAYGDSLEGVNDALRAVLQSGAVDSGASEDQIQGITAKVLDLSQAFGVDATDAANALGQMMRTGMAPNAEAALDIITRGFQSGADKSQDFLDTLNEYSVQFQKLGINGATATGIITQGLQAGARDGDLVADALKEFSIRAVDGSKASSDAFQLLGLDAGKLTAQIARGGPEASAGLQIVTDRLRGMTDPVQRNAAAVGLFGTQAEDLGDSLLAIDPSKAVGALGDVAGAADKMDTALGETASAKIESFKRSLETSLVDVIGNRVIPAITFLAGLGGTLFGPAWEPVRSFLGFMATTGAGVAAVLLAVAGGVKAWAIAQGILNVVMAANPVVLFVAALAGLVAGLVWAYNNVDWFRAFVDETFRSIATIATWLWQSVIVPVAAGFAAAFQAIGAAASWLWTNILGPTFDIIGVVLRVLGAIIFTVLVAPWIIAFNVLSMIVSALWTGVIQPVFGFIGAIATWLWANVLAPVFGWIGAGFSALGAGIAAIWTGVIQPVFTILGQAAQAVWNNVLAPVFDAVGRGWSLLWSGVSTAYHAIADPIWAAVQGALRMIRDAFQAAVDGIAGIWGRIQGIVRPPVDFVVNIVYNNGIRPAWNFIAGLFGLGTLPEFHFARGGLVPGVDTGRDYVHAVLRGGEGVLVPGAVEMIGGPAALEALNRRAEGRRRGRGQGDQGDWGYLGDWKGGRQYFATGGIVGDIGSWIWDNVVSPVGNFIGSAADFLTDPVGAIKKIMGGINTSGLGGAGRLSEALGMIPAKVIDGAVKLIKDTVGDFAGAGEGAGRAGAALAWAKTQAGKPYQWGGGGNPSWDCSGFMGGITSILFGRRPGRIGTTASMPWPGFHAGVSPIFTIGNIRNAGGGIGHMAGSLLGVGVESAGGTGVRVGNGRNAFSSLFPEHYTPFDTGGLLPEGYSTVYNGTGAPEPVLTPQQWDRMAAGGDGAQIQLHAREPLSSSDIRLLAAEVVRQMNWSKRTG
jgi:TP901 family phage tail tape measure protein